VTVYQYCVGSSCNNPSGGHDPAGNLLSYTDINSNTSGNTSIMGAWSFQYDTLNRLVTAQNTSTTPASGQFANSAQFAGYYGCWSYDNFGNRLSQAISTTPCANTPPLTSWAQYNGTVNGTGNNQMSATNQNANQANGYDAAGNVTFDGVNTYLYDGEGRICAVASTPVASMTTLTGYIYDAEGTRVSKGTLAYFTCDFNSSDTYNSSTNTGFNGYQPTNDYVLGPSGEQAAEMGVDSTGVIAWAHTNIWAGGTLLGTYDGGAGTYGLHFYLNDPLGTRRVQTDYAGVVEQTCQSLPYGDGLSCTGSTIAPTEHHFTGKERDAETGNDYFGARYFGSNMGRFLSPDWSAEVEPVPYAKLGDPQSLNLYSYLMNNPLGGVDADGHADPALPQEEIIKLHDVGELVVTGYRVFSEHIMGSVAVSPPAKCPVDQCVYVHAPLPPDPRVDFWCGNKKVCNPEVEREKWIAQRDFILGHNRKNAPNNGTKPIGTPKTSAQCSIYQDGSATGAALSKICQAFPNDPKSNQIRGCLQSLYNPGSGYVPIPVIVPTTPGSFVDVNGILPGTGAHLGCFANAAGIF
jgi:RHS repeat-associated protein